MPVPKTEEEFKALGTIECPECHEILDASDFDALLKHILDNHRQVAEKKYRDYLLDVACDAGILRRV